MPKMMNMPKVLAAGASKPYNISRGLDGTSAEITMYGEVVETIPVDWWTGEEIDGLYICLKDFLDDINNNLMGVTNLTIRINSPGGDLHAGQAIYNRLKMFDNVTTIVDGLAASAASLIAQAGQTRQVYASSQMMIHGASTLLFDWFNQNELKEVQKMLKAADDTVINVYAERTGLEKDKIKNMVSNTTWMVGEDIVSLGFADELITGDKEMQLSMNAGSHQLLCNGIPFDTRRMPILPQNVVVTEGVLAREHKPVQDSNVKEENHMTMEELLAQEPDLVKQIQDSAKADALTSIKPDETAVSNAVAAERQRLADIESIEASIADKELVKNAKYGDTPMDAKELAFEAMKKQAALGNAFLADIKNDVSTSGAEEVTSLPGATEQLPPVEDEAESIAKVVDAVKKAKGVK